MVKKTLLLVCVLFVSLFSTWSQEKLIVVDEDTLVILNQEIEEKAIEHMMSFDFGQESKVFTLKSHALINFTDAERRVLAKADRIQVIFNEDTSYVETVENVLFNNPGPQGLIKLKLTPEKNGEVLKFDGHDGVLKVSFLKKKPTEALITDDKVVFGILALILAFIFYTSGLDHKNWQRLYTVIPALFLCYMIPALLTSLGVIDPEATNLYFMASRYLLPGSLILLILSVDIKSLFGLGSKSLIMFFTGTVGIIVGGVFAVWFFSMVHPETVTGGGPENEEVWRGLATIAGSWIGGGANQSAMLEIYNYKETLFGGMLIVDIVVANIWMALILFGIGKKAKIDKWLKADSSSIDKLVLKVEKFQKSVDRKTTLTDYMVIAGLVFGGVALSHFLGGILSEYFLTVLNKDSTLCSSFFWMVVISTFYGLILSFTRARSYEGVGASKIGSVFLYILVATIGMKVDISKVFDNPYLIFVGLVWMAIHAILLIVVAKLIRAPFFFLAVGSQANVGGAASAPIVANAFHPALTTVGVLMAVFGYFIGTYGAQACAELMNLVSP